MSAAPAPRSARATRAPGPSSRPRPQVAVTRRLPEGVLEALAADADVVCWPGEVPPSRDELVALVAGADGILTMLTERVDGPLLDTVPSLRVVSNMAVGVDNIDVAELTARGIPLGHTPGVLTDATADLTFALILAVARRVLEGDHAVHVGAWTTWQPDGFLGLELSGATLGVVGTGAIGEAVIRRARGFGLRILATSRTERPIPGVTFVDLDQLLEESDIVTLHLPLSTETRHRIGRAELARMRPGAILVNTARGAIVDEEALVEALTSGVIGGAGLDVYSVEPLPHDSPLLGLPNCVTVPHIGSATRKTRLAMATLAAENVMAGVRGERLPRCANPEVYGAIAGDLVTQ